MNQLSVDDLLRPIAEMGGRVRLMGVGLVILGALACYAPQLTGKAVSIMVGLLLLGGGILRTAFAFFASGWGPLFLRLAVGILSILAGAYMIFNPGEGLEALTIVLIFYLIIDGVSSLVFAFQLPPAAGGGWVMLGAIASLIIAVLLWMKWPASGQLAIGVLIGIKLILDGVTLIGVGTAAKAAVRRVT